MNEFPILLYTTPEGGVKVNAVLKDETLWLTQGAMAELFGVWDIAQVLPSFSDRKIQRLLNALADKGHAKVIGKTKGAKWYLTSNN